MNTPHQPLSTDALDELLSADIDGEFDRAAAELGFTPQAARAAVDAAPGSGARRDSLLRARDLLAVTPALADDTEARLVTAALARVADERQARPPVITPLPRRRLGNGWRILAGVGTAAAVIAGVIALSATNPAGFKTTGSSSKAAINSATTTPPRGTDVANGPARYSVAFGDVSAATALKAKVHARLQSPLSAPKPTKRAGSAVTTAGPAVIEAPNSDSTYGESKGTGREVAVAAPDAARQNCVDQLTRAQRLRKAPVLSGSGTNGAQPVFVVVYRRAVSYVVYLLSAADCSVVSSTTLP